MDRDQALALMSALIDRVTARDGAWRMRISPTKGGKWRVLICRSDGSQALAIYQARVLHEPVAPVEHAS